MLSMDQDLFHQCFAANRAVNGGNSDEVVTIYCIYGVIYDMLVRKKD